MHAHTNTHTFLVWDWLPAKQSHADGISPFDMIMALNWWRHLTHSLPARWQALPKHFNLLQPPINHPQPLPPYVQALVHFNQLILSFTVTPFTNTTLCFAHLPSHLICFNEVLICQLEAITVEQKINITITLAKLEEKNTKRETDTVSKDSSRTSAVLSEADF